MATLLRGSLRARAARRWWYSRAEMPGVRWPGAIMCGCVSWSGWPNWISEAETISKGFREEVLKKEGLLRNVGDGRCIAHNRGTSVLFILNVRGL